MVSCLIPARILLCCLLCAFVALCDLKEKKHEKFKVWATRRGARFLKSISIGSSALGGLGLFANENIAKNTPYFSLPTALLITLRTIKQDPFIGHLPFFANHSVYDLTEIDCIVIFMFYYKFARKKAGPHIKPYFDMLPNSYNGFPLLFSEKELNFLKGRTAFYDYLLQERGNALELFLKVKRKVFDPHSVYFPSESVTFDNFVYCMVATSSRHFSSDGTTYLFPLADIINTKTSARDYKTQGMQNWDFVSNDTTESVIFESRRFYGAGEELFGFYNPKLNNVNYFLLYGFVPGEDVVDACVVVKKWCLAPNKLQNVMEMLMKRGKAAAGDHKSEVEKFMQMRKAVGESLRETDSVDFFDDIPGISSNILLFLAFERKQLERIHDLIGDYLRAS